ncbi:hypothetical protein G5I_13632 [Acromyrmex echinatior]|uniref:Uncharacterized protein n=1 Tax=Acromyrmex echinatior TaxID=103372 RepID=F4X5J8_ACREC|nr:hypothetical protein G5I_13632 [Acromyrmex echinatior]
MSLFNDGTSKRRRAATSFPLLTPYRMESFLFRMLRALCCIRVLQVEIQDIKHVKTPGLKISEAKLFQGDLHGAPVRGHPTIV